MPRILSPEPIFRDLPGSKNRDPTHEGGLGTGLTTNKPRKDVRKGDRHKNPRHRNRDKELKEKGLLPLGVYLAAALVKRVKIIAEEQGQSLQDFVREGLEKKIAEHEKYRDTSKPNRPDIAAVEIRDRQVTLKR